MLKKMYETHHHDFTRRYVPPEKEREQYKASLTMALSNLRALNQRYVKACITPPSDLLDMMVLYERWTGSRPSSAQSNKSLNEGGGRKRKQTS